MATENSEQRVELDLFGLPLLPIKDRRGRPSFKKTKENQQFVALRAAAGWTQEAIAADMGIDPKTLRKNFSRELSEGALMIQGQHLDVLSLRARQGHVSAIKQLEDMLEKGQRRRMARQLQDPEGDEDTPVQKLGKKEAAQRAARETIEQDDEASPWGGLLKPGFGAH